MAAVSVKRSIRHFRVVVVQRRYKKKKKCTKKRVARAKLLFCVINLLLFWRLLVAVAVVVVTTFLSDARQPKVILPKFSVKSSPSEWRNSAIQILCCQGILRGKTYHFRFTSVAQKRLCQAPYCPVSQVVSGVSRSVPQWFGLFCVVLECSGVQGFSTCHRVSSKSCVHLTRTVSL